MTAEPGRPALLALNRVTVMRGERAALEDLTLRIEAGEHVCILGPNGCGTVSYTHLTLPTKRIV